MKEIFSCVSIACPAMLTPWLVLEVKDYLKNRFLCFAPDNNQVVLLDEGINCEKNTWTNLNVVEKLDKDNEICCMCWGNSDESEICYALKSRQIQSYDVGSGEFSQRLHCPGGEGRFCGLSKCDSYFLTAVESGLVRLWREDEAGQVNIEAGTNLCCMCHSRKNPQLVGTGGKENDFKLWDINRSQEPVFRAKNVRNDWLNLRVPVWVLGIEFLPDSHKVVTCTGHHQVRVYDPSSSQRRPVMNMEFDEYPLTAMSLRPDGMQVIVGNTQGKMALLDLRKGKMIHCYKGFAGSIRSIKCHSTMSIVASCGLDRFLRVHDIDTGHMLNKIYLKSRLNCLLLSSEWYNDSEGNRKDCEVNKKISKRLSEIDHDDDEDNGDDEGVWASMKAVKTRTVSKQKTDRLNRSYEEPLKRTHSASSQRITKINRKKRRS